MIMNEIKHPRTGESCYCMLHTSGLPIYVWPKPGYASSYAVFATRYGSIDTIFEENGKTVEVPAGIAHYLEHKLFENEDCDAFELYAKTGANANAYTSFDRTAYLFSVTGDVTPSLKILLDFVQAPYFTQETVDKERGIITQEIEMSDDSPERRVFFNLLRGMYRKHPINIDIAGTVDSIKEITPALLYSCYRTFYHLKNMVLAVSGNVTPEQVLAAADKWLKPAEGEFTLERAVINEPAEVVEARVEEHMPVAAPIFYLGYKMPFHDNRCVTAKESAAAEILLELLAGKVSPLYARLMAEGLINTAFGTEFFDGPGYGAWMFAGESRDPDAVAAAINGEIEKARQNGFDPTDFEAARNALYGRTVSSLNDVENCTDILYGSYFYGQQPFEFIDAAAEIKPEDVAAMLSGNLLPEQATLSVISPE